MSEINFKNITEKAAVLVEKAAIMLPPETAMSIECSWDDERVPAAQGAIYDLTDNFITAGTTGKPVCPLCGGVVVTVKGTVGADDKEAVISAAADGVGALKSETKSQIVKSVSCPTAEIVGIEHW